MPIAPSPRPDGPLIESEILEWSERLEDLRHEDEEFRSLWGEDRDRAAVIFGPSVIEALDHVVELLLKKEFREEFVELLYGELRLCGRGFVPSTESTGGKFLRRWRLLGVVPPAWDEHRWHYCPGPRFALVAPFHVPIPDLAEKKPTLRRALDMLLRCPTLCCPRPPAPIADYEVRSFAENIRAELHAAIRDDAWRPPNRRLTREQWFYSMEQSIELLLEPEFQRQFSEVLYGRTDFHDSGYGLEDGECRRHLRQRWGVTDVTYPEWDSKSRHYLLFTGLSVPWRHWTPRGVADSDRHFNARLQLIHRDELNSHPHYLLTCTVCRCPQGAFAPPDWVEDAGPDPRTQVANYVNQVDLGHPDGRPELQRIAGRFSEEILGFGASHHRLPDVGSFQRSPESGPIAELLDWVMGLYDQSEFPQWHWLGDVIRREQPRTERRLVILADLLALLQCQVCREIGSLRYCPTFAYHVAADLDPSTQATEVKRLALVLRASKERVAADTNFKRLLVFPDELPRQRLAHMLKRAELRHEDAIRHTPEHPPNTWLIALWVAESLADWPSFCERLGYGRGRRAQLEELEGEHRQLVELKQKLSHLRAREEGMTAQMLEAKRLLATADFSDLAELLVKHLEEKLRDDLDQFRFRTKKTREARETGPAGGQEAADTSRAGPRRPDPENP